MNIFETIHQELHDIELTEYQKKLLALSVEAGAVNEPSHVSLTDEKLIAARDLLDELEIIEYSHKDNTIHITDIGEELLQSHGVTTETGELTQDAKALIDPNSDRNSNAFEHQSFMDYIRGNSNLLN